jgi:hypothetical protein
MPQLPRLSVALKSLSLAVALVWLSGCLNIADPKKGLTIFTVVSGNGQTIPLNATNVDPLVVRTYDETAAPLGGVVVTWAIVAGGGTLSTTSTTTDAGGNASVTYKPGTATGIVTIKATAIDLNVTFTETVVPAT